MAVASHRAERPFYMFALPEECDLKVIFACFTHSIDLASIKEGLESFFTAPPSPS